MRRKVGYLDASGGFVAHAATVAHQREEEGDEQSTYGTPELVSVMRNSDYFAGWLFCLLFSPFVSRRGSRFFFFEGGDRDVARRFIVAAALRAGVRRVDTIARGRVRGRVRRRLNKMTSLGVCSTSFV